MPGELLTIEDLSVAYDGQVVVRDVTLDLPEGQVLAVLGPSGCGKSTLLRAIAGLEPAQSGRILLAGRDLAGTPTHKRGFALMFQDGQLFEHQSVARNIGYALRIRREPRAEVSARVAELLDLVNLTGYADRAPSTLSGGERQRVALARALAVSPRLLLLDEPLSALDATLREHLGGELREILTRARTTALMVTHDHEEAFAIADRMALMRAGRLVQAGGLADVWQHPVDAEAARFLGYAAVLTGAPAGLIWQAAGSTSYADVALRRSALRLDDHGSLQGLVVGARATPELWRLRVRIDGLPELDAVAPLDRPAPAPGARVPLAVDPTRLAPVGR
jgi:thiamine transport system ATP-binding protein